jgi:hypothetical protein
MKLQPRYAKPMLRHFLPALLLSCLSLHSQETVVSNPAKDMAAAQQRIKKISATEYDLDGIKINAATREVRIPTEVRLKKAPIEFMLTTDTGKTHETVLTTTLSPTAVQVAMLLVNYQPATEGLLVKVPADERPKVWKDESPKDKGANRVKIRAEWKVGTETKNASLSQWVQNADVRQPPPDLDTWIFNGSSIDERGFIAQHEGSIIGIWLDRGAIFNSPAEGNWRDDLWISLPANIPDEGTPVTLIITPEKP